MAKEKKVRPGRVEKPYSHKTPKTNLEKMSHKERAFIAAANRNDRPDVEGRMKSAREASNLHRERTGRGLKLSEDIVMSGNLGEEEESPMRVMQRRHWNPMYNPVPVPITQAELIQHLRDNPAIANNMEALIEGARGLRPAEQVEPVEPQMAMELSLFVQINHQLASQNASQPGRTPQDMPTPPGTLSRKTSYGPNMSPSQERSMASPLEGSITASSPTLNIDSNVGAPQMERQTKRRHTSFSQDATLYDMPDYRNPGPQFMGRSSSTPGNITSGTSFDHDSMMQNARAQLQANSMHQNSIPRSPEPQTHMNQVHQSPLGWYAAHQSLPQVNMAPQQTNQFPTHWNQERPTLDMSYVNHYLPSQASQTNAVENNPYSQFAQPSSDEKFFADLIDFNGGGR
ncbi:hypothetical protein EAE96_011166 [Botrytis aclada]|nr:hypothetical protein EAE96_011166 [Botrytis aclada]